MSAAPQQVEFCNHPEMSLTVQSRNVTEGADVSKALQPEGSKYRRIIELWGKGKADIR